MLGQAISSALIVAGVVFCLSLLRLSANRPAKRDPETGELVLQCSPALAWIMALFAVGGAISMGLLSLVIPFAYPAQVFVPIGIGAFFLLLGGGMCLWAMMRRTRVGERGLTSEYVFYKPRFLAWEDVRKVSFASGQEFWVHGPGWHKAMLHVWFVGIKEAIPLLYDHLPEEVQKKGGTALARLAVYTGATGD